MDLLRGVAGIRMSKSFGRLRPEVYLGISYDFVNDADSATVSLPNGSSYTMSGEKLNKFGTEANIGISYDINDHTNLNLGYEGRFRKHYQDHTGVINLRYTF